MSNKNEQNLTDKQRKTIVALLEAKSIGEGVSEAHISRTTFYEWMKDPQFRAELKTARNSMIENSLEDLRSAAHGAVGVLRSLLESRNENIRLRASSNILEHILRHREIDSVERRIENIEKMLDGRNRLS